MEAAVTRYRIAAYVVGVLLLMLAVGMVFKYGFGKGETFTANVAQIHGIFYVGYFVTCFDLWRRTGWPLQRMALMALAGVVPGLNFRAPGLRHRMPPRLRSPSPPGRRCHQVASPARPSH